MGKFPVVGIEVGVSQRRQESERGPARMDHVHELGVGRVQPVFRIDDAGDGLEQGTRGIQAYKENYERIMNDNTPSAIALTLSPVILPIRPSR